MNRLLSLLTICGLAVLVSCQPEDTKTIEKDFSFEASATTVNAGETVTFTDLSINVESRTWTFPDGTPATSAEPVADVVFSSAGTKEVTLVVTYSDGTEDRGSIDIEVLDPLGAEISVSGLTEKGCAKKGAQITFSLADLVGEPDSYEWTFPGGNPATSIEASPVVTWNSQMNDVEVTCVLKRNADGASTTVTRHIIAGNYPLYVYDAEYGIDATGFESGEVNKLWYNWGNFPISIPDQKLGEYLDIMSIADGGANGTAKCMRLDLSKSQVNTSGMGSDCTWQFGLRKNWSNNPWLVTGQKYEVSISLKAEGVDGVTKVAACDWIHVESWCPADLTDPLRSLGAQQSWKDFFDEDFTESGQIFLFDQGVWLANFNGSDLTTIDFLANDWKTYTYEFTVSEGSDGDVWKNCYVAFGIQSVGSVVYVDEVQLNLIEE